MQDGEVGARRDPRDAVFDVAGLDRGIGRQTGRASVIVLVISFAKVAVMFAGIAVIARLVPPTEYGIFALAMPAVALTQTISSFGLPQAIVQRPRLLHHEASTLFWTNLAIATVAAGMVAASAGFLARFFAEPTVAPVYIALAGMIPLAALVGFYGGILRRRLRAARLEMLVLGGESVGLAVAIAAALAGASYWALVLQQYAVQTVIAAAAIAATRWWPSPPHRSQVGTVMDSVGFGGYVAGVGLLNKVMDFTGAVVAGAQISPAAAGLYNRAARLGNLPDLRIMQPLSGTIVPALSRLQNDPALLRTLHERMIARANLMLMPVAVIVAAGADPIVAILLGQDWSAAAPLLFWMSFLTLRAGVNHGLRYALLACGQSRALFLVTIVKAGFVITAILLAAPQGLVAMAAAYTLTELFVTVTLTVAVGLRRTPLTLVSLWRSSLAPMVLASVLAAALLVWVDPLLTPLPALVHLAALALMVTLVYGLRVMLSPALRRDAAAAGAQLLGKFARRARAQ